jgi:hypothetical protein
VLPVAGNQGSTADERLPPLLLYAVFVSTV